MASSEAAWRHLLGHCERGRLRTDLSSPFRINRFASVSRPSNSLCLTWGANLLPSNLFLRSSLTLVRRPQLPIWPWFRPFHLSPFVSRFRPGVPNECTTTPHTGRFLPFSGSNRELVNSSVGLSEPKSDVPKPCGATAHYRCPSTTSMGGRDSAKWYAPRVI